MTPARLDFTIWRGTTFNPIVFNAKDGSDNPINLTGWEVFAKSRNGYGQIIDLDPVITNATTGQITIGSFSPEFTSEFNTGNQTWDFMFERPNGDILGPYTAGTIAVKDLVATQPLPVEEDIDGGTY